MTDKVEDVEDKQDEIESLDKDTEKKEEPAVETPTLTPQEEEAKSFGWLPKDEWVKAGNAEEDHVPAKHFMKFGQLKQEAIAKDRALQKQEKVIKLMRDHHMNVRETAYKEALAQLKRERQTALEEGEVARAEFIRDKIDEVKEEFTTKGALPKHIEDELKQTELEKQSQQTAVNPDFPAWHAKNPWYIPAHEGKQDDISAEADTLAIAIVQRAVASGKQMSAKEVYDAVETKIKKMYPEKFKPAAAPKSPMGDSPSTSAPDKGGKGVKLSEEELAVARNFGLTPEEYAKQLKTYKGR